MNAECEDPLPQSPFHQSGTSCREVFDLGTSTLAVDVVLWDKDVGQVLGKAQQ